jgi:hypothetical protein
VQTHSGVLGIQQYVRSWINVLRRQAVPQTATSHYPACPDSSAAASRQSSDMLFGSHVVPGYENVQAFAWICRRIRCVYGRINVLSRQAMPQARSARYYSSGASAVRAMLFWIRMERIDAVVFCDEFVYGIQGFLLVSVNVLCNYKEMPDVVDGEPPEPE